MSFSLYFPTSGGCDPLEHFDEGVELAFRLSSAPTEWIPIAFIYPSVTSRAPPDPAPIGTLNNLRLRGYDLEMHQAFLLKENHKQEFKYTLCAPQLSQLYVPDYIQFRWLQTSLFQNDNNSKDVWSLDNIIIDFVSLDILDSMTFEELFENSSFK